MSEVQFNFEQAMMDCWGVVEDLDILFDGVMDKELPQDKIANIVLGMKDLYNLKFEKLQSLFEAYISEQHNSISE